ncbi:curlin subunit CsgB [Vibrio diazotrophicus]|uniref:curlin subunit CsgB n=1 Tax=Vibrio diazotrophicus TaxID=685 RepID=UPI002155700A|nr:curlin subunit CsgB [Vibrio diazotrophicus]
MSIRNNACFSMLVMGIVLYFAMSNLAWANDLQGQIYYQSESNHGGGSRHRDHSKKRKYTQSDDFGYDLELSKFDELDFISTDGNYAEVVLEGSKLGNVYIEQGSSIAGNKAKVVQSDSVRSEAEIWQYGGDNTALITQKGNFNTAYIAQYGYGNNAWINQSGYNNTAAIIQYGYGSSLSINQTGSNNKAILIDNGGSNYGISQNGNDYVAIVGGYGINVYVTQN